MSVPPNLPPRDVGDGYDWIDALPEPWSVLPIWGRDGWDLGSWPYVIVVTYIQPPVFALGKYVEGDITVEQYDSKDKLFEAIDKVAEFYWRHGSERGPKDLPEHGTLEHHRGPYREE